MNNADQVDRLDVALDALLAVRVALGGLLTDAMPDEALDEALRHHEGYQAARRAFVEALYGAGRGGVNDEHIFAIESAAHTLAARAAEVGWRLGVTARTGTR
ncbi:MAG: hypothetical protein AMXMBFR64_39650 [Myxococcales bacterium]